MRECSVLISSSLALVGITVDTKLMAIVETITYTFYIALDVGSPGIDNRRLRIHCGTAFGDASADALSKVLRANYQNRTDDPYITNVLLYRLMCLIQRYIQLGSIPNTDAFTDALFSFAGWIYHL